MDLLKTVMATQAAMVATEAVLDMETIEEAAMETKAKATRDS